jgi:hypothetical protein
MPALQPARLKIQASELVQWATDPSNFCLAYHKFLDNYADRTYRPGQVGEPPPLLRAYHVPDPVLRAVVKEMNLFAGSNREAALELADALWMEPYLEFRLLAASALGQISPIPVVSVIQRVENWAVPSTEERLINALVNSGLARLRLEHLSFYQQQMEIWISSDKIQFNRLGLKAIPPLLENDEFEDFPLVFNQLSKAIRGEVKPLKTDILVVIKVLAARSPAETAYFLSQMKNTADQNLNIDWFIRNSRSYFPPDSQKYLREVLLKG